MKDYEYDIHLPSEQKKILLKLVSLSEQHKILSFEYAIHKPNEPPYTLSFFISDEDFTLYEDPIPGFEVLEFVQQTSSEGSLHTIFLKPKLFKWVKYENKNGIMKWIERNSNLFRDVVVTISFILSVLLTIKDLLQ